MKPRCGHAFIGISGWRYVPWRGVFYPRGLARRRELCYAARTFNAIEINGTFYSLQRPQNFRDWRQQTPDGFVFAVKAPRYITHVRRLRDVEPPLANFFASGLLALGERLGPMLWQFPPSLRYDAQRLADFLALLRQRRQGARAVRRPCARGAARECDRCGTGSCGGRMNIVQNAR